METAEALAAVLYSPPTIWLDFMGNRIDETHSEIHEQVVSILARLSQSSL